MSKNIQLNTIEEAIEDIRQGKVIIVVDDEDRENEGDFLAAAEKVTPEMINFMATHGRGLICAPLTESRCKELDLHAMVRNNTDHMETAFTVSPSVISDATVKSRFSYPIILSFSSVIICSPNISGRFIISGILSYTKSENSVAASSDGKRQTLCISSAVQSSIPGTTTSPAASPALTAAGQLRHEL